MNCALLEGQEVVAIQRIGSEFISTKPDPKVEDMCDVCFYFLEAKKSKAAKEALVAKEALAAKEGG